MADFYVIFESDDEIVCVNAAKGWAVKVKPGDLDDYKEVITELGLTDNDGAPVAVFDLGLALLGVAADSELAAKIRADVASLKPGDQVGVRPCVPSNGPDYKLVFRKGRETDAG